MSKMLNRYLILFCFSPVILAGCKKQISDTDSNKSIPKSISVIHSTHLDATTAKHENTDSVFIHNIEGYKASEIGWAIYQDSLAKFRSLVENGAAIENAITDETYIYDALYTALVFNRINLVNFIIENNYYSDINKTYSEDAETPLTLACNIQDKNDALQIATFFIAKGAKVDGSGPSGDEDTKYPLISAAKRNNVELIKTLIKKGANKEVAENSGTTAASIAADSGFSEITELLK